MQARLTELYGKGKIYGVKKLRDCSWVIHAPSMINDIRKDGDYVTLIAGDYGDKRYYVLVSDF